MTDSPDLLCEEKYTSATIELDLDDGNVTKVRGGNSAYLLLVSRLSSTLILCAQSEG